MPMYQLEILIENLPAIEAEEEQAAAVAATAPHMKDEHRRQYLRSLRNEIRTMRINARPERYEIIEHDPALAAEWFGGMGIKVKH